MRTTSRLIVAAVFSVLALGSPHHVGAVRPAATAPPEHYFVTAGWGNDDYAANIYTPNTLQIYAGDTVTWRIGGKLEPHTISFGPTPLLEQLHRDLTVVTPQRNGPPAISFNAQVAFPTRSPVYNGAGYANSGVVGYGQKWTIRFTRPGRYTYHCLLHFPGMMGLVVVNPRPAAASTVVVRTGYGSTRSAVDAFFPDSLVIRAGTTVIWTPGFHTVSFGPPTMLQNLRAHFVMPVPQKAGPPIIEVNPAAALPTGGPTYNGAGFWNSGLLIRGPTHLTFTTPGVYHYKCLVHPGMDGTIIVTR